MKISLLIKPLFWIGVICFLLSFILHFFFRYAPWFESLQYILVLLWLLFISAPKTLREIYENDIKLAYDQKLANFKSELSIAEERSKSDFLKSINNNQLYISKKHEVLPKTYQLLYKHEISYAQIGYILDHERFCEGWINKLNRLLKRERIPPDIWDSILKLYQEGNSKKARQDYYNCRIKHTIAITLNNLHEYFLENELYFSKETSSKIWLFIITASHWINKLNEYNFVQMRDSEEAEVFWDDYLARTKFVTEHAFPWYHERAKALWDQIVEIKDVIIDELGN